VEDRAHLQRDVVPGDHVLRRDVHRDRAQVDADRLLDARDHVDDPGPREPTRRPRRNTTARSYSRRTFNPLSTNAPRMASAAHAPSIATPSGALGSGAPRPRDL